MELSVVHSLALQSLRQINERAEDDEELSRLIEARDEVIDFYQRMFTSEKIVNLKEDEFREFLMFRNNKHWTGLQRMGPQTTADMPALRSALSKLIDVSIPVEERLDELLPDGKAVVHKLGKAVLTPILLIAQPTKFGVWNGTSEAAMRLLNLWPDFKRGMTLGEKYYVVNGLLLEIANELNVDLWTLDALWWRILRDASGPGVEAEESVDETIDVQFGLERHLHDFLLDNWEKTDLGKEWDLVEEGGDIKGYGYERSTAVGRIDLLAYHKTDQKYLVIELKRDQTSDSTIGQVLRYMGWVAENLALDSEKVEGLIIALRDDEKLRYALKMTSDVKFMRYMIEFQLVK